MKKQKAQGATEYLLILASVIVVSVIVIALIVTISSSSKKTTDDTVNAGMYDPITNLKYDQDLYPIAIVAAMASLDMGGNNPQIQFVIKNLSDEQIEIRKMFIGTSQVGMYGGSDFAAYPLQAYYDSVHATWDYKCVTQCVPTHCIPGSGGDTSGCNCAACSWHGLQKATDVTYTGANMVTGGLIDESTKCNVPNVSDRTQIKINSPPIIFDPQEENGLFMDRSVFICVPGTSSKLVISFCYSSPPGSPIVCTNSKTISVDCASNLMGYRGTFSYLQAC
ncbi:MAG: hypothetical protein WC308_02755 [archaeon]|jgi:hypothetical protein